MATRELKPGLVVSAILAQAGVTDHFGIKNGQTGQWPRQGEAQIIPQAGNSAFSVTIEHTLDPTQASGWNVVATITTTAPATFQVTGGWYRATVGTATGGSVQVLIVVA